MNAPVRSQQAAAADSEHRYWVSWGMVVCGLLLCSSALLARNAPKPDSRASSDTLRTIAARDSGGQVLVDLADRLETLARDSNPSVSSLASFLRAKDQLLAARSGLAEAQDVLARAMRLADARPRLAAFQTETTTARARPLCDALRLIDPTWIELTTEKCRERYGRNGPFERLLGAREAGVAVLRTAVTATNSRTAFLEAKLQKAQDDLDDTLQGKASYTIALAVSGLTTIAVLLLLTYREDVRRRVFTDVHATELVTLVLVVMAVIFFGSRELLKSDAVSGLLGAIAGYVLGRQTQPERAAAAARAAKGSRGTEAEQRAAAIAAKTTQPNF
jgi:hypothetical protein